MLGPSLTKAVATPTARLASSTWSTGPSYFGAIRSAVCARLVVAPPISSGIVIPDRFISSATVTISSRLGVIRPLKPIIAALFSLAASRIRVHGTITPRSMTSNPLHCKTTPTMFLPMS